MTPRLGRLTAGVLAVALTVVAVFGSFVKAQEPVEPEGEMFDASVFLTELAPVLGLFLVFGVGLQLGRVRVA